MATTSITPPQPDSAEAPIFLVTRRELVVLTVALAAVVAAILLLVITSGQVAMAVTGNG